MPHLFHRFDFVIAVQLINPTVFPTMTFDHWDQVGREQTVVILKATIFRNGATWSWRQEQPPILLEDHFDGDPAVDPLVAEQEIAPHKPATDLTLKAVAHAPVGMPLPDWPVEITIPDRLTYGFHVRGPVQWQRRDLRGWQLGKPEPVRSVSVDYRLAYGGTATGKDGDLHVHGYNPAGCGFTTDEAQRSNDAVPAPQIGILPDLLRQDMDVPFAVHGFGPVARTWLPRRALAGTYDEAWLATRHPRLPGDFDPRYWNSAPGPLQINPYLRGGEEIRLRNLHPNKPDYRFTLPGAAPRGHLDPMGILIDFSLDTVMLDVTSEEESEHSATLIWRTSFPASDSHEAFRIHMIELPREANPGTG